jgi:hypothetical protein
MDNGRKAVRREEGAKRAIPVGACTGLGLECMTKRANRRRVGPRQDIPISMGRFQEEL